jgi:secreted trypsin-like serine protease
MSLLLLLVAGATLAAAPPPIVNGTTTDDHAQAVLIRHTTADGSVAFICTGTLIAEDVVLTAAHCLTPVEGYNLTDQRVSSGSVWTPQAPERKAADWLVHPDYSVSDDGLDIVADLGLVFLDEPYSLPGAVLGSRPITEADFGSRLRHVGWGASTDTANDQGYAKRAGDMPLTGLEGEFLLSEAADDGQPATCGGDSGGPVFRLVDGVAGSLVGVHSFGRDDDSTICAGSTSGDTRVDLYLDWLLDEVPDAVTDAAPEKSDGRGNGATDDDAAPAGCASTGGAASAGAGWGAVVALAVTRRGRAPRIR